MKKEQSDKIQLTPKPQESFESSIPSLSKIEQKLSSILQHEDTVLFIGSGVSRWSGLPSWSGLIEALCAYVEDQGHSSDLIRREFINKDFIQAASFGFEVLTPQQRGHFIRTACHLDRAEPHIIHQQLVMLGPRAFITTNYDPLLEKSFSKWQPDRFYRVVTNKQPVEMADIIGARARDYLFKYHGDIQDSDSIIFTREQYRLLSRNGERSTAFTAIETILSTRAVVYIGFGLRDPDFLQLRDSLANTYKGGQRDHYAIMAGVGEQEKEYYRKNYGIHIISYELLDPNDPNSSHNNLLLLLDRLSQTPSVGANISEDGDFDFKNDQTRLMLARYAATLYRIDVPPLLLPLNVSLEKKSNESTFQYNQEDLYWYNGQSVQNLLNKGPEKFLLIGSPGSGKSFALRHNAAKYAEILHEQCIAELFNPDAILIPVYVDIKLYEGSIINLIEQNLPKGINLKGLHSAFKLKIYLDAFNEIPKKFIEDGHWDNDFNAFLESYVGASIIISSRTIDGLQKINMPVFSLDQISGEYVEDHLKKKNASLAQGALRREMIRLFQKPFFFRFLSGNDVDLVKIKQPKDFYIMFFDKVSSDFSGKFQIDFNIIDPLSDLATYSIDSGEEAIPASTVTEKFQAYLSLGNIKNVKADDIVSWFVEKDILTPFSGGKVAFFHQSITEFLAARSLAKSYIQHPHILNEKVKLRSWDQALFLTLNLLPKDHAESFSNQVMNLDFKLAVYSVKFMEADSGEVVSRILKKIPEKAKDNFNDLLSYSYLIKDELLISDQHEMLLRDMINEGNALGGAAVVCLYSVLKKDTLSDLLNHLVLRCNDYNFCSRIGSVLKNDITKDDISHLAFLADKVQERISRREIEDYEGFADALGQMLSKQEPEDVYRSLIISDKSLESQAVREKIFCDFLVDVRAPTAFNVALEALLFGIESTIFPISLISRRKNSEIKIDWSSVTNEHIKSMASLLFQEKNEREPSAGGWSIEALREIIKNRADLIPVLQGQLSGLKGVLNAVLLYIEDANSNRDAIFKELEMLCQLSTEDLSREPLRFIRNMKMDWVGYEPLFVRLLRKKNSDLTLALLESVRIEFHEEVIGKLDIGPIEFWLEWLQEVENDESGYFLGYLFSEVFSKKLDVDKKKEFVAEFNKESSIFKRVLADKILNVWDDLSTDDLSEDAISYLLSDLSLKDTWNSLREPILGRAATEIFVLERLLPLLPSAERVFRKNLVRVLNAAGKRHGKRYVIG